MIQVKPIEELTFIDDFMFKKVLTLNPNLCEELLQLILEKPVHILTMDAEHTINSSPDGKGIRMDIYIEDDINTIYDIEMQTTKNPDFAKRTRYYQSMLDSESLHHGESYRLLRKSCIIFICTSDYFGQGLPVYRFSQRCDQNTNIILDDDTSRYFLNPRSDSCTISTELKNFLQFILSNEPSDSFTEALFKEVNTLKSDPKVGVEYMSYNAMKADLLVEGQEAGKATLIQKALQNGATVETLAQMFGLDIDEVKRLASLDVQE